MEYEEMINQLEFVINSKPYELPKLEELFCFGCSHEIIDGSYKGKNYGNGNGKKLLSMLNEKTKLLFHKKIETLKGSRNSDYSFNIEEHEYILGVLEISCQSDRIVYSKGKTDERGVQF